MEEARKQLTYITVNILKTNPNINQSQYPKPDPFQENIEMFWKKKTSNKKPVRHFDFTDSIWKGILMCQFSKSFENHRTTMQSFAGASSN